MSRSWRRRRRRSRWRGRSRRRNWFGQKVTRKKDQHRCHRHQRQQQQQKEQQQQQQQKAATAAATAATRAASAAAVATVATRRRKATDQGEEVGSLIHTEQKTYKWNDMNAQLAHPAAQLPPGVPPGASRHSRRVRQVPTTRRPLEEGAARSRSRSRSPLSHSRLENWTTLNRFRKTGKTQMTW